MKKNFFFLFVLIFSICGVLNFFEVPSQVSYAISTNVSSWQLPNDKTSYEDLDESDFVGVTNSDYFDEDNKVYINSAKGFAYFAYLVNNGDMMSTKEVHLTTDIDLGNYEWAPIFNFKGDFDGEEHYIYNMKITKGSKSATVTDETYYAGLFGNYHADSTKKISNLHLRNVNVNIGQEANPFPTHIGGLVAALGSDDYNTNALGIVEGCSVNGNITVTSNANTEINVGGVLGSVSTHVWTDEIPTIQKLMSAATITVNAPLANVGGIVGAASCIDLQKSYSTSKINFSSSGGNGQSAVGGIVGNLNVNNITARVKQTTLMNCYFAGELNSGTASNVDIGGIAGRFYVYGEKEKNAISNVYSASTITAGASTTSKKGEIIGFVTWQSSSRGEGFLKNAFAVKKNGDSEKLATLNEIYNANSMQAGQSFACNGCADGDDADLITRIRTKGFYQDEIIWGEENAWDFDSTWAIQYGLNGGLPYLVGVYQMGAANNDQDLSGNNQLKGLGTADNPYLIETAGDLAYFTANYDKGVYGTNQYFSLQNDINLINKTWIPIGTASKHFSGVFDGNGHTISNLTCSYLNNFASIGLFGYADNAVIKNLIVENCDFYSTNETVVKGAFIGTAGENTYLINVVNKTSLNDVGSGSITKIKGKLNQLEEGNFAGYDITIDPNGGTFYGEGKDVYKGEYHILLNEKGVISQDIDETFGKNIPDLSTKFGQADTVIRRGYKRLGFSAENVGITSNADTAVMTDGANLVNAATNQVGDAYLTLYTVWLSGEGGKFFTEEVYVVYNQYELANFNASDNADAEYLKAGNNNLYVKDKEFECDGFKATYGFGTVEGFDGEIKNEINNSNVYVKFNFIYDSKSTEYDDVLWGMPQYKTADGEVKYLRDGFEVATLHTQFVGNDFSVNTKEKGKLDFINDSYDKVLFAEWKGFASSGTGEKVAKQTLKITFKKVEEESVAKWAGFNAFDWSDVFGTGLKDNIHLNGYVGNRNQTSFSSNSIAQQDDDLVVEYTFGTNYSDKTTNYIHFYANILPGFIFTKANLNELSDSNFGKLKVGTKTSESEKETFNNDIIDIFDATKIMNFYNLIGNNDITIYVERKQIESDFSASREVVYGLSPNLDLKGATQYNLVVGEQTFEGKDSNTIFGYSFEENKVLFYTISNVDGKNAYTFAEEQLNGDKIDSNGKQLLFKVDYALNADESYSIYYLYTFETRNGENWFALYQSNEGASKEFLIAAMKEPTDVGTKESQLVTFMHNDFNLIYKTSDGSRFGDRAPNAEGATVYPETNGAENVTEGCFKYTNLQKFNDNGKILLSTDYTLILIEYQYNYDGENAKIFDQYKNGADGKTLFVEKTTQISVGENITGRMSSSQPNSAKNDAEKYFKLSKVSVQQEIDGELNDKASDVDVDNFDFNLATQGWTPGRYVITVGFVDVTYTINLGTKFVSHSNMTAFKNLVDGRSFGTGYETYLKNFGEKQTDFLTLGDTLQSAESSTVSPEVIEEQGTQIGLLKVTNLLYNSQISITPTETAGVQYYGFLLRTNSGRELNQIENYDTTLGLIYDNVLSLSGVNNVVEQYVLNLIAIFEVKELTLSLSDSVIIENYNGTSVENTTTFKNLKLTGNVENFGENYVYNYQNIAQQQELKTDFTFTLGGNNANFYDIASVRLGYIDDVNSFKEVNKWQNEGENPQTFSQELKTYFDSILEEQSDNTKNYLFQYVIKQHKAEITFRSGAAEGEYRASGARVARAGEVKSGEQDVVNATYTKTLYFGQTLNLLSDQTDDFININTLFGTRKGYSFGGWNVYGKSGEYRADETILDNVFAFTTNFNQNLSQHTEGTNTWQIHIYKLWRANGYEVTFDGNGNDVGAAPIPNSMNLNFDEPLMLNGIPNNVKKFGYTFLGWDLNDKMFFEYKDGSFNFSSDLIENDKVVIDGVEYFAKDGENWLLCIDTGFALTARWQANTYKVTVDYNRSSEETDKKQYDVVYGKTFGFKELLQDVNSQDLKRSHFTYAGVFYVYNNIYVEVTENDVLTNETLSAVFPQDAHAGSEVLTLYVAWDYDYSNPYALTLTNTDFGRDVYKGERHFKNLADKFNASNIESSVGFNFEAGAELISLAEDNKVSVSWQIGKDGEVKPTQYSATNVGQYYFIVYINFTDEAVLSTSIPTISIGFTYAITPAEIVFERDEEAAKLVFAKKIIEPYYPKEDIDKLTSFGTINTQNSVAKFIADKENLKNLDDATKITTASEQEIYEYIIVKFYLMSISSGEDFRAFKNWTYQNYIDYKTESGENVQNILNNLNYFEYYTYGLAANSFDVFFADIINLKSGSLAKAKGIEIESVKLQTDFGFVPNAMYTIRLYLTATDLKMLDNFQIEKDGENYYVDFAQAFLLKQTLELQNTDDFVELYYIGGQEKREVGFKIDVSVSDKDLQAKIDLAKDFLYNSYGRKFYLVDSKNYIFVAANAYTSNSGNADEDTPFNFKDEINYIYFDNVLILALQDINADANNFEFESAANYFNLTMNENYVFTIKNTKGVAHITVQTRYNTFETNSGFEDYSLNAEKLASLGLDANLLNDFLYISEIGYAIDGISGTINLEKEKIFEGRKQIFAKNGDSSEIHIADIEVSNGYSVEIFASSAVTQINFSTRATINDNIAIFKWSETTSSITDFAQSWEVQRSSGNRSTKTWKPSGEEEENNNLEWFAIYTDMVAVTYTNIPGEEDYALIKIGQTKYADLTKPKINGFNLDKMVLRTNESLQFEGLFDTATGLYKPYFATDNRIKIFQPIEIKTYWIIDTTIVYESYYGEDYVYTADVYSFTDVWTVDTLLYLRNMNTNLFTYTYEWAKVGSPQNQIISKTQEFSLDGKGTYQESGLYRLTISSKLKDEYLHYVDEGTEITGSTSYEFTLQFLRRKVTKIEPSATESYFAGSSKNLIGSWGLTVTYEDSAEEEEEFSVVYNAKDFVVTYGDKVVTAMIDAGVYTIKYKLSSDLYDISALDKANVVDDGGQSCYQFTFTIKPVEVELDDFSIEKTFNTLVGEKHFIENVVASTGESVAIALTRDKANELDEHVGAYKLYLDGTATFSPNYTLKKGSITLVENGVVLDSTQELGMFYIRQSGGLEIRFDEVDEKDYTAQFDAEGYTFALKVVDGNISLQISCKGSVVKSYNLKFFDKSTASFITNSTILSILQEYVEGLTTAFRSEATGSTAAKVLESGIYFYVVTISADFNKYYQTTEMSNQYRFIIERREIETDSWKITKVYDGNNTLKLDLEGHALTGDAQMYVTATFSSIHAENNLRVTLVLEGSDKNLANYKLTQTEFTNGEITPREATMTFGIDSSFTYGEISESNLESLITRKSVIDEASAGGNSVEDILYANTYSLSYGIKLADNGVVQKSKRGFYFVGTYSLDIKVNYSKDFYFTIAYEPATFTIDKKIVSDHPVTKVTRTVLDEVEQEILDTYYDTATGDTLILHYSISGDYNDNGHYKVGGPYDFVLEDVTCDDRDTPNLQNNYSISIAANNQGLQVTEAQATLYITILSEAILKQTYVSKDYTFSISGTTLSLNGGAETVTSEISFFIKDENKNTSITNVDASKLTIFSGIASNTKFKNVGNYNLGLSGTVDSYTAVSFDKTYVFVVEAATITVPDSVTKVYDGNNVIDVKGISGVLEKDQVIVSGRYEDINVNEVGADWDVSLTLSGEQATNYKLSKDTIKGTITKANAHFVYSGLGNAVFGTITKAYAFERYISAFEGTEGNTKSVSMSQYELNVSVKRADDKPLYSEANFLHAGTYTITFAAVAEGTRNYTISNLDITLTITAYSVDISFSTPGQIQATFGEEAASNPQIPFMFRTNLNENIELILTRDRAAENQIGYYKITGAQIAEEQDYSNDYTINFLGDTTDLGAYQIVAPNLPLYVLLSDKDVVNSTEYQQNNEIIKLEYDGKTYSSVSVGGNAADGYQLVITSSDGLSSHKYALSFYTTNNDATVYTKYKENIVGLSAKFAYISAISKNVGTYWMNATSITAGDYSQTVKFGRYGETSCFALQITQKIVTLNVENNIFERPFTNTQAIYHISNVDAPTMLKGLVAGEGFGFTLTLYENAGTETEPQKGEIAQFVNAKSCIVEGKIDEDDVVGQNYILDTSKIKGRIAKATLVVVVNNRDLVYNYGQIADNAPLPFEFENPEGVVAFDYYRMTQTDRLDISIHVDAERGMLSSAEYLKVGTYGVRVYADKINDFNLQFKVDRTIYNDDNGLIPDAVVEVLPIKISLSEKAETFDKIFTKRYDGTTEVQFKNGDELRFNIVGVLLGDEVLISNVEYENAMDGNRIAIIFKFAGKDLENYDLSQIQNKYFGTITAIRVKLAFDAHAEGSTVVNQNGGNVSDLFIKYPFENGNISASILDNAVFPVEISGKAGHAFLGWYMLFEVESGSAQHTLLQSYAVGLESDYTDGKFRVNIQNNIYAMNFFAKLLEDPTLGYYYKDDKYIAGQQIAFLLEADWATNSYEVTINIVDENGNPFSQEYDLARVEYAHAKDAGSLSNVEMHGHTCKVMVVFDDVMRIGYKIKDDNKCDFIGFYLGNIYISELGDGNFVANETLLEIAHVKDAYVFNLRFRISPVEISLDFTACENATVENTTDFHLQNQHVWTYSTNYFALKENDITLAAFLELAQYSTVGYVLTQLSDVVAANFDSTYLYEILPNSPVNNRYVLNLVGQFEPKQIEVILHFGYLEGEDEKFENRTIAFGTTFGEADWWQSAVTRFGYDFVEWNTSAAGDGKTIDEQTQVDQEEKYELYAIWEKQKVTIHFEVANATVVFDTFEGLNITRYDWGYEISRIDFETTVAFTINPNLGYEIGELSKEFVLLSSGKYQFTIPANTEEQQFLTYQIPINKKNNQIVLQGDEFISKYEAYEGETAKQIDDRKFNVLTDNAFRIEVTAAKGYEMMQDFEVSGNPEENTNFVVSSNLENRIIEGQTISVLTVYITGIKSGLTFNFTTSARLNKISITFQTPEGNTNEQTVGEVYYENNSHTVTTTNYELYMLTGQTLILHVKFAYGFGYEEGNCATSGITVSDTETTEYTGYYKFVLSGAQTDASMTISAKREQFTLKVEVRSYDDEGRLVVDGVSGNEALVNGEDASVGVKIDYNTEAILTIRKAPAFGFEGWLLPYEDHPFDTAETITYRVVSDITLYAAFYEGESYVIWFGSVLLDTRYLQVEEKLENRKDYSIFSDGGLFYDKDEELLATGSRNRQYATIKNITATEFMYATPDGYDFVGFGYYIDNNFVVAYDGRADFVNGKAVFSIKGNQLQSEVRDVYVILQAKEVELSFSSELEIEDETSNLKEDISEITIRSGVNTLNTFGYIDNTRIHFAGDDFVDGKLVSNSEFSIVAHSNIVFELLINVTRKGFVLSRIDYDGDIMIVNQENPNGDGLLFNVYILSTNTGYFGIKLVYTSQLNFVDLSFVSEKTGENFEVDGGLFRVTIDEDSKGRAWVSSNETPQIRVSGYTNVGFSVTAFIRAGFTYKNAIIVAADGTEIIVGEISYEKLVIADTGFTGKVTFKVRNFLDLNSIKLMLIPTTYNVLFKDGDTVLLTRSIYYFENFDFGLDEIAKLTLKRTNYVYQGYFTRENGAGRLYVNSDFMFVGPWTENGYVLNSITPTHYVLDDNAQMLPDGSIEISLYLYMSYLKTRITVSFKTPLGVELTAKDLISGVNNYNSWYYFTEPMSIEVAYGTDIRFIAPKVFGFEFYKMIIAQRRPGESEWSYIDTSNYASSNNIPWTSDEADAYSECQVELWYFRQINVQIDGGLGKYTLSQEGYEQGSKGTAYELNQRGYYDPNKEVTVFAEADEGYRFVSWSVYPLIGRPSTNSTYTVKPNLNSQLSLKLSLAGKGVLVKFDYDRTNGNILEARQRGFKGEDLGTVNNPTEMNVAVGDTITLKIFTSPNYGLIWNYKDIFGNVKVFENIKYVRYEKGYQYFQFEILQEYSPNTWGASLPEITIMPIFESQRVSVFITTTLDGVLENAVDENDVRNAGRVLYQGQETKAFTAALNEGDIIIEILVYGRYSISQIVITNKGNSYSNPELFENGKIVLSTAFIEENSIEGSIAIDITFKREVWEDEILENEQLSGWGSNDDPYRITSVEDLILMMRLVNSGAVSRRGLKYSKASYILTKDLNLTAKFWTPIGTEENPFDGTFNFNGHKISGVNNAIFYEEVHYLGLFGVLGPNVNIYMRTGSNWYLYLIIPAAIIIAIALFIAFFYARKRKKTREDMAKK